MNKVLLYDAQTQEEKEISSQEAIEILERWPGDTRAYLDLLAQQGTVSMMGTGISWNGAFPHEWKIYGGEL